MRFSDIVDGFWLARRRDLSQSTVTQYTQTFTRFDAYLRTDGNPDWEAITANHVRGFLNHLAELGTMNKKTIANNWVALSSLWTWASAELGGPHVIRGRVPRPQFAREQPEPYTEAEIRHLLDACEYTAEWSSQPGIHTRRYTGRRDRAILLLLVDTGLRASELCNLKIRDFDRKTGRIAVHHGKGDKGRSVYPGQAARSALWRYLQERSTARRADSGDSTLHPHEPLFCTNSGQHIARDNLLHTIVRIARRAGVQHANVHKFRHTFAINFLRNGGNIYALQDLLGHSDLETVRIYLKLADRDLRAAMNAASPADTWRL